MLLLLIFHIHKDAHIYSIYLYILDVVSDLELYKESREILDSIIKERNINLKPCTNALMCI